MGAVEVLAGVHARQLYVTNNASRSAAEVAEHLRELGFDADAGDVVTSAQSAAHLLASQLDPESPVLIVGTDALAAEITAVGLRPVRQWSDGPVAVVQGHSPTTAWSDLAEAALAIRGGATWVAANVDRTLPSERGLLPGNGSMVAALRAATDAEPQVAGKPAPTLLRDAIARGHFDAPLVVGDRLDTDIAGANAAQLPCLMVLCGVSTAREAVYAQDGFRTTYIGLDLRSLNDSADALRIGPRPAWRTETGAGDVTVSAAGPEPADDGLDIVRVLADALWRAEADGREREVKAGDDAARCALDRWSLLDRPDPLA